MLISHSKEYRSVLGGHLISINVPLRKEEGYILIPPQSKDLTYRHNVPPTLRE
jgi:hypothetical protein